MKRAKVRKCHTALQGFHDVGHLPCFRAGALSYGKSTGEEETRDYRRGSKEKRECRKKVEQSASAGRPLFIKRAAR